MSAKPFLRTLGDLQDWIESTGRTVQIVCRTKASPTYAVRILRTDSADYSEGDQWFSAFGHDLSAAFEAAYEKFLAEDPSS